MYGRDPDRVLLASERVYRVLLAAYPKEFREAYGSQMVQVFRDLCRDKRRGGGIGGLVALWARTGADLAVSALVERSGAVRLKFLVPLALVVGLAIALVDTSPGWDDTGISAAAVFGSCVLLGVLHPARPWLSALMVGLWIPALGIILDGNYESWIALAVAFAGAYAGALIRRSISAA